MIRGKSNKCSNYIKACIYIIMTQLLKGLLLVCCFKYRPPVANSQFPIPNSQWVTSTETCRRQKEGKGEAKGHNSPSWAGATYILVDKVSEKGDLQRDPGEDQPASASQSARSASQPVNQSTSQPVQSIWHSLPGVLYYMYRGGGEEGGRRGREAGREGCLLPDPGTLDHDPTWKEEFKRPFLLRGPSSVK